MSQQSAFEYLRHGQTPLFRLPVVDFALGSKAYDGFDAVFLGVPFDGGTTYQPGARMAPYHVRRVSALVQPYHVALGFDVFRTVRAVDGGNVAIPPFNPGAVRDLVQSEVMGVLGAGAVPFVIGGDHTVALPALRAVAEHHGPVAVVHVDAHLDTSGPEVWAEAFHHGTPLRHALAEGLIEKGQLYQLGIRGAWGTPEDAAFGAAHGARLYKMDELEARTVISVMDEVRAAIGERPVYLTFDIDAVDPAFAPGTGTPAPGGLTSREALQLVRGLAGANIVGVDLVEVAPALDHADMTNHLAAAVLYEALAALAAGKAG